MSGGLCRCPMRPVNSHGSMASGSATETANLQRWEREHGVHAYARLRDELANSLQQVETATRKAGAEDGGAVLDMVHDVFGLERRTGE